jgi:hypothetical protein
MTRNERSSPFALRAAPSPTLPRKRGREQGGASGGTGADQQVGRARYLVKAAVQQAHSVPSPACGGGLGRGQPHIEIADV